MEKETNGLKNELIKPSLDLALDYSEIALDDFIDNPVLREVPVIKTLTAIVRTGVAIKERFFIKKFAIFLRELHSGILSNQKFEEFKSQFETDIKYREKVLENILLLIENSDSVNKSKILAHIFNAHINGEYNWDRFNEIAHTLIRIPESCYIYLHRIATHPKKYEDGRTTWLLRYGGGNPSNAPEIFENADIYREISSLMTASGICYTQGTASIITKLGQDVYFHGISKAINF